MNEPSKHNPSDTSLSGESDVVGILKKIQQQLGFLENKIDTLINNRPPSKPFNRERSFSRPHRPFGHSRGRREGGFGDRNRGREKDFRQGHGQGQAPERPAGEPQGQGNENRGFPRKRKRFFRPGQD